MPYPIEKKLVVGVSSSALFNLEKEEAIFSNQGPEAFDQYQVDNKMNILEKGVALPFVQRFLNINKHYPEEQPVEVVLLSKNSPNACIRVFNSIKEYDLDISRAVFTTGKSPFQYIPAYNISLFLSTNISDVEKAITAKYPAGRFINSPVFDDGDNELRVAFDFDGVIADDAAEKVYKETKNLADFHKYETEHIVEPHTPGPLADFFKKLAFFQKLETKKHNSDPKYNRLLRTAIVTARNAPSHERAVNTLNEWGVSVDEMFLMGGVDKSRVLKIFKPHIYFDDQLVHLDSNSSKIPLVHIPFGIANESK
ncbi:MAG: 5'-nucleotidase [Ignavibacteria bacterium]|nr:5'-nucleotidase [Ignavibacteria bacterium]